MEHVACNLCKADDAQLLFNAADLNQRQGGLFSVVRCRKCALVYIDPRPSRDEMARWYPDKYYLGAPGCIAPEPAQCSSDARVERILRYRLSPGAALDIGCNRGDFLACLKARGWRACGVELSALAAARAREVHGLEVTVGDFADARYPAGEFDLVTMWHTLEHVRDPLGALHAIRRVLKADGLLALSVPNMASFQARAFREKWYHLDVPRHLYHFTPRTLGGMLAEAGFRKLSVNHFPALHNYVGLRMSLVNVLAGGGKPDAGGGAPAAPRHGPWKRAFNAACKILALLESMSGHGGTIEIYAQKTDGDAQ